MEQELYAVVLSLKHWKHYVYGYQVFVYSDQKSLSWGIKQCDSPRMMRWIKQLSEFKVKIFYREGRRQAHADFLSRMEPLPESKLMYDTEEQAAVRLSVVFGLETDGPDYFKTEQRKDEELLKVIDFKGTPGAGASAQTRKLAAKYVLLPNGILAIYLHGRESRPQYIVPSHLRSRILEELHDCVWGAHLGVTRTFEKIAQRFYWEGLRQDVINWISSCQGCATRKLPTNPTTMGMQLQAATSPWQVDRKSVV